MYHSVRSINRRIKKKKKKKRCVMICDTHAEFSRSAALLLATNRQAAGQSVQKPMGIGVLFLSHEYHITLSLSDCVRRVFTCAEFASPHHLRIVRLERRRPSLLLLSNINHLARTKSPTLFFRLPTDPKGCTYAA